MRNASPFRSVLMLLAASAGAPLATGQSRSAQPSDITYRLILSTTLAARRAAPARTLVANADLSLRRRQAAATEGASATVTVSGATISEADLLAGVFMGQTFSLAPGTTFEINDAGAVGPVGISSDDSSSHFNFNSSTVNINSGIIGDLFTVDYDSTANISGGTIGSGIRVFEGGAMNLFVLDASIDGVALDLGLDETIFITSSDAGSLLEATLADGSFFDLILDNNSSSNGMDFIFLSSGASLSITRVEGAAVPAP